MSKINKYLLEQQEELMLLADKICSVAASIRLARLFADRIADESSGSAKCESHPKLEEAIKCIAPRYKDREKMAKLVIANRHLDRKDILKLCQRFGWLSENTGLDNVRFIDKILNLFKQDTV